MVSLIVYMLDNAMCPSAIVARIEFKRYKSFGQTIGAPFSVFDSIERGTGGNGRTKKQQSYLQKPIPTIFYTYYRYISSGFYCIQKCPSAVEWFTFTTDKWGHKVHIRCDGEKETGYRESLNVVLWCWEVHCLFGGDVCLLKKTRPPHWFPLPRPRSNSMPGFKGRLSGHSIFVSHPFCPFFDEDHYEDDVDFSVTFESVWFQTYAKKQHVTPSDICGLSGKGVGVRYHQVVTQTLRDWW